MLEVTVQIKEKIKFPVTRQGILSGVIVVFFSETYGVVLDPGESDFKAGESFSDWSSCSDNQFWISVNITITG